MSEHSKVKNTLAEPKRPLVTDPMDDLRQASADVSGIELTKPSPAQIVLAAAGDSEPGIHSTIAAALHAAASQLLAVQWNGQIPADTTHQIGINWARDALHVLANEIKAQ